MRQINLNTTMQKIKKKKSIKEALKLVYHGKKKTKILLTKINKKTKL